MDGVSRVAWIVGGSRGIGFACARMLGEEGYRLALSARDAMQLQVATEALSGLGFEAASFPCDVTSESGVRETVHGITQRFGTSPHTLIQCAGISPWSTFSETTVEEFDRVIATNVRGVFLTSREVLSGMYARHDGAIVQILSVASIKAYRNGAAYVASKFAAHGFTNALREEARQHGVRVIAVFPGATETELWGEEERTKFHAQMMQPEDIAEAIRAALNVPHRALVEEIMLRPIGGDLDM